MTSLGYTDLDNRLEGVEDFTEALKLLGELERE